MVEMELFEIRYDETAIEQVITLSEKGGTRQLPIVIGPFEAQAISLKVNNYETVRPLTHDLTISIIKALGAEIKCIVINKLERGIFFAEIIFHTKFGEVSVDSRPSDAIALAIAVGAKIYVEEEVLSRARSLDE